MSLGDLLEWIAVGMIVAAAGLWGGLVLGLALGGVGLFYLAQSSPDVPLRRRRGDG